MALGTAFVCILVFALLRGVLHYAEQGSNHYIAFKLLALIRDKVFGVLRQLAPAKLEGRDKGDLIALLTADIELLEVFYAHTISPICIAIIVSIVMACFTASYAQLLALYAALAGYLLVGIAVPVCAAKGRDKAAREYRQALAHQQLSAGKPARPAGYSAVPEHAPACRGHHGPQRDAGGEAEGHEVGGLAARPSQPGPHRAADGGMLALMASAVRTGTIGAEGVLICTWRP